VGSEFGGHPCGEGSTQLRLGRRRSIKPASESGSALWLRRRRPPTAATGGGGRLSRSSDSRVPRPPDANLYAEDHYHNVGAQAYRYGARCTFNISPDDARLHSQVGRLVYSHSASICLDSKNVRSLPRCESPTQVLARSVNVLVPFLWGRQKKWFARSVLSRDSTIFSAGERGTETHRGHTKSGLTGAGIIGAPASALRYPTATPMFP